jgi:fatty acid desaturase
VELARAAMEVRARFPMECEAVRFVALLRTGAWSLLVVMSD